MAGRIAYLLLAASLTFGTALTAQPDSSRQAALIEAENQVLVSSAGTEWKPGIPLMPLSQGDRVRTGKRSRAGIRLSDLSVMRLDQITMFEIVEGKSTSGGASINLKQGGAYLFSRERAPEIELRTPAANGALRGTQLIIRVTPALRTLMFVLEGEVELSNPKGSILLRSGEQGEADIGAPPRKTAVIEAKNILQWALYYPGVINPADLGMADSERRTIAASLQAYARGDLLGALEHYPVAHAPRNEAGALYRAATLLSVGRVDESVRALSSVGRNHPGRLALEQMIAAVNFEDWTSSVPPSTAGELLAQSYYAQSKADLEAALAAARKATALAPDFGFAWVRLAELEFSFGRVRAAKSALERGLALSPNNAQAYALKGFLLSAENEIRSARDWFTRAIALDGALGNAWLGRGLTYIREGQSELGRQDLQAATMLEPNRSIFHSYLGKAFSMLGDTSAAQKDLKRAKELDPNDPTPWLYSALQRGQENRYNEAIADLERSSVLNRNRRVYRSDFLLDEDQAVRSSNLAALYRNNEMRDVAVREAIRAVDSDYANASSHLFLANAYDALRDPRRVQLRYETVWSSELLLSHLLAPVGGGSLSQFVSQQEYSKLFEADGFGFSSFGEYYSNGELRQAASQFGSFGNASYALDVEYLYNNGIRPNNDISRLTSFGTFKFQIAPQDTIFLQIKYEDLQTGDVFQRYDARGSQMGTFERTYDFRERQEPGLILAGLNHQWQPGTHTLLLLGRLANEQIATGSQANQRFFGRNVGDVTRDDLTLPAVPPVGSLRDGALIDALRDLQQTGDITESFDLPLNADYRAQFEIFSGEINHIATIGAHTLVLGARYQSGTFETRAILRSDDAALKNNGLLLEPADNQSFAVDFDRASGFVYETWQLHPALSVTGGLTYDTMRYPSNFRFPPISDRQTSLSRVSPKIGFIARPWRDMVIRGAYAEAVSGASFEQSVRLEPTQVAGFSQVYRTAISEVTAGSVAGGVYKIWGLSVEQKLPTRTYLGVEFNVINQDVERSVGAFQALRGQTEDLGILPFQLNQRLAYREDTLTASVNQLLGDYLSIGSRYRFSKAKLRQNFYDLSPSAVLDPDRTESSSLHEFGLFAAFNHPSGFTARLDGTFYNQENDGFDSGSETPRQDSRPGDSFWHFNLYAGWRFNRNQCEIGLGIANLTDTDYRLEPLNYYLELPRERTFFVRAKLLF